MSEPRVGTEDPEAATPTEGTQEGAPEELRRVILFQACDEWFGLPIQWVREVKPLGQVTRVPNAPPEILGILNLRGRVLTLFHLAGCLGIPVGTRPNTHGVVLDLGDPDLSIGLAVQGIGQVRGVSSAAIEPPPPREKGPGVLEGVFELEGQVFGLLDLARVFARYQEEWGLTVGTWGSG